MRTFNFSIRKNALALGVLFCILVHALVNFFQHFSSDYVLVYGLASVIIGVVIGIFTDRLIVSRPSGAFAGCALMGLLFSLETSVETFFLLTFISVIFGVLAGFLVKRNVMSCSAAVFSGGIVIGGTAFLAREVLAGFPDQFLLGFASGCALGGIMGGVISLVSDSLRCRSLSFQRVLTDKLLVAVAVLSLTARFFLDLNYVSYDIPAFSQIFLETGVRMLNAGFIGVFAGIVVAVLIDRKFITIPIGAFASTFLVGILLAFSLFSEGYDAVFVFGEMFVACLIGVAVGFLVNREIAGFRLAVFAGSVLIGVGLALFSYYFSGSGVQTYDFLSSSLTHASIASLMGAGMSSAFLFCRRSERTEE